MMSLFVINIYLYRKIFWTVKDIFWWTFFLTSHWISNFHFSHYKWISTTIQLEEARVEKSPCRGVPNLVITHRSYIDRCRHIAIWYSISEKRCVLKNTETYVSGRVFTKYQNVMHCSLKLDLYQKFCIKTKVTFQI